MALPVPERPLVSVTIPAYNAAPFLREAVDSALAQDYKPIEVVVGNDGSTDETAAILRSYGDKVRVVEHPDRKNHGLGATRNLLVRESRGELIALLDADDQWLPGKLSLQVAAMAGRPEAGMCHTAYEKFGDPADCGPVHAAPDFLYEGRCFEKIFQFNAPCVPTVMLRRSALPAHGFYEDLHGYEDYALWLELMFNHPVIYLPQVTARYRRHPAQITRGDEGKRRMVYRGLARLRFLDLYGSKMQPDDLRKKREWTLDELQAHAYSRYWKGDFAMARLGFGWLGQHGRRISPRHRLRAWIGSWSS